MDKIQVGFSYGAISEPIEAQANKQGYTLGDKQKLIEKLIHARNMLMFHVLTDKQEESITGKIHKLVVKSLKPLNKVGDSDE